ncbi:hypothetical protein ACJZ2D_015013 [Fusarium nematophilum]
MLLPLLLALHHRGWGGDAKLEGMTFVGGASALFVATPPCLGSFCHSDEPPAAGVRGVHSALPISNPDCFPARALHKDRNHHRFWGTLRLT